MAESHEDQAHEPRLQEARRALERNWPLIALNGKVPVHKGWQKSKPPSITMVERWLRKGHNLGLLTGRASGVLVIDDDSPGGSAAAALNLPKTVTVVTGSGKKHYYFALPQGLALPNSVKTSIAGMDVRADGGQVAFVGSLHPDTKRPYCWATGCSPDEVELAALPASVLELLRKRERAVPQFTLLAGRNNTRSTHYVQAALRAELSNVRGAAEGARNDTLNRAAFALGQLVGGGHLDRALVDTALLAAARNAGLPDSEATKTIASGIDAGVHEPRDIPAPVAPPPDTGTEAVQEPEPDTRAPIQLCSGWIHLAADAAEDVLQRLRPAIFYQRGPLLVRVNMVAEAGASRSIQLKPIIQEVSNAAVIDVLTRLVRFERHDQRTGKHYVVDCPERLAQTLLSRAGQWGLQPLLGVIDAPTLRPDGSVLCTTGYDAATGLLLLPGSTIFPTVPMQPTEAEAQTALGCLLEILKGFPFLEPVDRSVALAAVLTALIRPSLRTAPMFAFRAAKMGSGKSLLADVVSLIATGRCAAVMSQGADEHEDKKRMLPILAEGDPVAVIDNIERPFGSAALCSILTQPTWRDRVLGKSQTMSLPTANTTWLATGNNIVFVGDITTRTLVCDLDPKCERPEERKFEVNLHRYVPDHRAQLVVAGLTLLRAYHVAGRPKDDLPTFGRFEEWSDWIRQAVVWLGLPDPCATRRRIEETDPVRAELAQLLLHLHRVFGSDLFKVAQVMRSMPEDEDLASAVRATFVASGHGDPTAQALGYVFQRANRRPEGGLRLVRGPQSGGSATWRIERV